MNNVVLSTRNIDDLVSDIANEVIKKINQIGGCQSGGSESSNSEELLTVPQIAKYLSLSTHYVYVLISRGELPIMKRGKRVYASKADLFNYLREGRKKTNSEIQSEAANHVTKKKSER